MERPAVSVYRVPTDLPGGDATLTWDATTLVLVEATAAGRAGLGFTYGSAATAPVVEHEPADLVVGHDALDVPAAGDRMSRALRNAGRPGIAAGAVSAVDTALWNLKARLPGLPLVRLLGAARDEVAVYGSGGLTTYDDTQLERQLRGWADQGIDRAAPTGTSRPCIPGLAPADRGGRPAHRSHRVGPCGRRCGGTPPTGYACSEPGPAYRRGVVRVPLSLHGTPDRR
ncbi:hypothetical protein ACH4F6_34605 [Streptomyces sp. NPDC017936]|uniref:hypothetical protein n=1 Tax=Streptomyces sp. NPDC017936 TaxID=3365016 RepID=UPI00378C4BD8